MGGILPAEPSQFRSDIFKQTPPGKFFIGMTRVPKIAKALGVPIEDLPKETMKMKS